MNRAERVLIAIGGNTLNDKASGANLDFGKVTAICERIVRIVQAGYLPVITFGNGPQVGMLYDMAETSALSGNVPITLDTCVSWTQGEIGYGILMTLQNLLRKAGLTVPVVAINTTTLVDPNDEAFDNPTKPVGHFIGPDDAQRLYEERGWIIGPDANRGFRRMVPSPRPMSILEIPAIQTVIQQGIIPLCGGGGGIPVYEDEAGQLKGIEAVIDKDFTSCLLAKSLGLENVVICTEVDNVYLNFGQPNQTALETISLNEARRYAEQGHFAAGSMGPKMLALLDFVASGGKRAIITSLDKLNDALDGKAGTAIVS